MDKIILTLHPLTDAARDVIRDERNAKLLVPKGEALELSLNRPPKRGETYVMGRRDDADIVLTDPASSARHCTFSIDDKGIPSLHEQSTNGTFINGTFINGNKDSFEVRSGTQIEILGAAFTIHVPWRGTHQDDYEYHVRRAKESRAKTPLEPLSSRSAPIATTLERKIGSYTITNVLIDRSRLGRAEVSRTELVSKGKSLLAAKRFNTGFENRELRTWKKISGLPHMSFKVL